MPGMRFSTHIVLFIVISSGLISAADTAGMWDDWGIEPETGVSEQIDRTVDSFEQITVGGIGGQTLINMFVFGAQLLQSGFKIVTALPTFLESVGVPQFIAQIPTAALIILVGRDVLSVLIGRVI